MSKNSFLNVLKAAEVKLVEEIQTTGFIDTGSYALNALLSASIFGGIPNNRTVMYAGDPSAGKTYLILEGVKAFQKAEPTGNVLYFDTEWALDKESLERRGIDMDRFFLQQPDHLQDFKTTALNILEAYEKEKKKTPLITVLDSLGQLPTKKEIEDTASGSDTRDMTKAQIIKSAFRILTQKLGKNNVPMLIANHTYDSMSQYTPKAISGGSGGLYAASTIIMLSKSSDKEKDKITKKDVAIGNIIRATTYKSRYTKEKQTVELRLDFETGLDRYYGLLPLAQKAKVIKKIGTKFKFLVGEFAGTEETFYGKEIEDNPEKFYTDEVLQLLDKAAKIEFGLGTGGQADDDLLDGFDDDVDFDEEIDTQE